MSRYYKIKIQGELSEILDKLRIQRNAYFKEVKAIAKEFGAMQGDFFGCIERGNLLALKFKEPPDQKIWKPWRNKEVTNAYCPRLNSKAGKEIDKRFQSLPKSDYTALWDHINWSCDQFIGNRIFFKPGFQVSKDKKEALFVFDEQVKYKPIKGMTPITWEEYKKLGGEE